MPADIYIKIRVMGCCIACASALAGAQTALADQNPPGVASGETADSDSGHASLEEIVVTARKRNENLRDVPESVEVVAASQLAASNVTTLSELTSVLPTLVLAEGTTNP